MSFNFTRNDIRHEKDSKPFNQMEDGWLTLTDKKSKWPEAIKRVLDRDEELDNFLHALIEDGDLMASTSNVAHWFVALNLGGTFCGKKVSTVTLPQLYNVMRSSAQMLISRIYKSIWHTSQNTDHMINLLVVNRAALLVIEDGVGLLMDETDIPIWSFKSVGCEGEWRIIPGEGMSGKIISEDGQLCLEMVPYQDDQGFCTIGSQIYSMPEVTEIDSRELTNLSSIPMLGIPRPLTSLTMYNLESLKSEACDYEIDPTFQMSMTYANLYSQIRVEMARRRICEVSKVKKEYVHDWDRFGAFSLSAASYYVKKNQCVRRLLKVFFERQLCPWFRNNGIPDDILVLIIPSLDHEVKEVQLVRSIELSTTQIRMILVDVFDESPVWFVVHNGWYEMCRCPFKIPGFVTYVLLSGMYGVHGDEVDMVNAHGYCILIATDHLNKRLVAGRKNLLTVCSTVVNSIYDVLVQKSPPSSPRYLAFSGGKLARRKVRRYGSMWVECEEFITLPTVAARYDAHAAARYESHLRTFFGQELDPNAHG